MKRRIAQRIPLLLIILISLAFAKLHINKRAGSKDECFTICGDARGYYAWLPAIFIYHDLNFRFFDSVEMKDTSCGGIKDIPIQDYRYQFNGNACDKYYPGASLMMLPFFAIAHTYTAWFTSYPPNGYSMPYFSIMALGAVFYYFLGMLFLLKILVLLNLNNKQKILTILFTTFGSNIIYYVIDAPLYSHVYSFALIAAFVYYTLRLNMDFSWRNIALVAFLIGFIFVTRPVNVSVVLVVPFVVKGGFKRIWNEFAAAPRKLLGLLPALLLPAGLFTLYKISVGQFFLYSYNKEGFDFLHPHFLDFIFHYDNGIFLYTPVLLMPVMLLFIWYRPQHKTLTLGLLITILATVYIHSSWWCWNYSFSFGPRTMLDFLPLFGMLIALSLKGKGSKQFLIITVYTLCCFLTLLLYHQKSANHFMGVYPIKDYWQAIGNAFGITIS